MRRRYRRHRGLLCLLAACALAPWAGAQEAWRFERLLDAAWSGHPAVLGKRAGVQAARGDLEGARWQRWPTPSIETGAGTGGSHTTLLRLEQPVWNAGRIDAAIDAAGSRLNAADASVTEARQELGLKLIAAWAEARRQQERARYAAEGVREHERLLQMIDRRVAQEVSPAVDRKFAQSRLLQVLNDQTAVRQALAGALTQLGQLVGQPVGQVDETQPAAPGLPSREAAVAAALDHSPVLRRLAAEEQAAQADITSRQSALWPALSLRLEKSTGTTTLPIERAMIVLSAQPGAGLSASAGVEAAVARREAARQSREAAVRDINEQIGIDWEELQAARDRLSNAREARSMSAEVFESYSRQYVAGRKSWIDVLNAVRETTQADFAMADANAQALAAGERLRLRTGAMLLVSGGPSSAPAAPAPGHSPVAPAANTAAPARP
jgi:adhesin transport system outer membrane protein